MKHCKDCEFIDKKTIQDEQGRFMTMFFCGHIECSDPVSAEPLPAGMARKEVVFCGIQGKYWKKKEEPVVAPVLQLVPK